MGREGRSGDPPQSEGVLREGGEGGANRLGPQPRSKENRHSSFCTGGPCPHRVHLEKCTCGVYIYGIGRAVILTNSTGAYA